MIAIVASLIVYITPISAFAKPGRALLNVEACKSDGCKLSYHLEEGADADEYLLAHDASSSEHVIFINKGIGGGYVEGSGTKETASVMRNGFPEAKFKRRSTWKLTEIAIDGKEEKRLGVSAHIYPAGTFEITAKRPDQDHGKYYLCAAKAQKHTCNAKDCADGIGECSLSGCWKERPECASCTEHCSITCSETTKPGKCSNNMELQIIQDNFRQMEFDAKVCLWKLDGEKIKPYYTALSCKE